MKGKNGQPVTQVRQALNTDSETDALRKAAQVEAARIAEWAALAHGDDVTAHLHYQAARKLAEAQGFGYRPISELIEGDLRELAERVPAANDQGQSSRVVAQSVLGTLPTSLPPLDKVLGDYYGLTATRHLQKSDNQKHRWKLPRDRAVNNFLEMMAERHPEGRKVALDKITRDDALAFRAWWSERVQSGMKSESANKDFGHLREIVGTWCERKAVKLENPFTKLRLEGGDKGTTPPFSRNWVETKLLAYGTLDRLNEDARDIFLMMINTALRPSEITDAPLEDIVLNGEIPFHRVAPNGRELKVMHTRREIPLLGVSLEAAKRIVDRGGTARYRHKAGSWSAAVNKFLDRSGLKETPEHVAYSLRHYVEDALLNAGIDDRVRADVLGHKYDRPNYGSGGGLAGRRAALARIAL